MDGIIISSGSLADLLGVSRATIEKRAETGVYKPISKNKEICFLMEDLFFVPQINEMLMTKWDEEKLTQPIRPFTSVELFAGAGGLAIGLEQSGFKHVLLNEIDKDACETLRTNRPDWNVIQGDIHEIDFRNYRGMVDLVSGGFPCQAFSYAGKRLGFEETRGTLFFELARAVNEIRPAVFMCENVKGLQEHDGGKTLATIKNVIEDIGYVLIEPRILKAIQFEVPQKRERLILIAIRKDLADDIDFKWPSPARRVMTLRDAFFKGDLYDKDVPVSEGQTYPESKKRVLELVPEGGDWRDLPDNIAKNYMKGSYNLGGGKTGMARRLSFSEPSLTLTCSPAQKQTERCHPIETRPLTVREYARIQTFPDDWKFCGSMSSKYKQIGNAVPVNLSSAIGRALVRLLNHLEVKKHNTGKNEKVLGYVAVRKWHGMFEGMVCEDDNTLKDYEDRYTDGGSRDA
ncbi:MAG: DNA (cytosine-5-)-methyltransferase [Paramuribaculum sp.]|nr:DNA (cytosine-5-)-methyltransferase [Paramuribaculum sp.]